MRMAENTLRFAPPIGWFGKIKGESGGEHSGQMDIKKGGIFAITDGIKAMAIEGRLLDGSTSQRLDALRAAGTISDIDAENPPKASSFVRMRLRSQVEDLREGRAPDNYVVLDRLNAMEQGRLKIALAGVEKFQGFCATTSGCIWCGRRRPAPSATNRQRSVIPATRQPEMLSRRQVA